MALDFALPGEGVVVVQGIDCNGLCNNPSSLPLGQLRSWQALREGWGRGERVFTDVESKSPEGLGGQTYSFVGSPKGGRGAGRAPQEQR